MPTIIGNQRHDRNDANLVTLTIELADRILYRDESPGPKLEMDLKKRSTPEIISFNKLIYIIVNNTIEYGQFYRVEDIDDHCPKTQFFVETPLELYKY